MIRQSDVVFEPLGTLQTRKRIGRFVDLQGGIAAARDGKIIWRHQATSTLVVRDFSDAFLDQYLDQAGDILTKAVGCYAFEGLGVQLFERVEGDYFAILGLDLVPVLNLLREQGVLDS